MTEAVRRVMLFGYQELGLHKVVVSHFSVNEASEKLIKRLGFRYIGEQVEEFRKDGVWHSHKTYELLEREFLPLNQPETTQATD
jgi:ribosomal-protein-alanine N-acetyltransferase